MVRGWIAAVLLVTALLGVPGSAAAAPQPNEGTLSWGPAPVIAFGQGSVRGVGGGTYVVNPDGSGLRKILPGGTLALHASPDGKRLLVDTGTGLATIGVDGNGLHDIGDGFDGSWSPNGKTISVVRADGIYLVPSAGGNGHLLFSNGYTDDAAAWSPDGSRLAYVACSAPYGSMPCEHQYGLDVYTIGANGSGRARVTKKSGYPQCPAWSKTGKLAFVTGDPDTVAIVQPNGSLRTFRPSGCPVWSPNGLTYAVPDGAGIGLLNADGTGRRVIPIVHGANADVEAVAWSPSGKQLAVATTGSTSSKPHSLWVVNLDGTGLKKLL